MKAALSFTALVGLYTAFAQAAPSEPNYDSKFAARSKHDHHIAKKAVAGSPEAFVEKSYDYVIVGAGTAGLAVAAKLSESGKYSVGVLEAGPDGFGDPINEIPGQFGANLGTKYDYNYTTAANSQTGVPAKGWPRGHVVGGSSILNFLVWDAASKKEYDAWEQLGNPGWNWKSMNAYMKASENFTAPSQAQQNQLNQQVNSNNYGHKGGVDASFPRWVSKQVSNWVPALESLGIPVNNEPLAGNNTGASLQPSDINPTNSTRDSSAAAYYYPNSGRRNLALLPNARVDKITFASKGYSSSVTANGVAFTSGGKSYTVKAKKEVIVSGGAVNSPQILELSGIGSASVLKSAGIKQIVNNSNVGENLQDHTYSFSAFELKDGATVTLDSLRINSTFAAEQKALYEKNQVSILDETVPAIAYISLARLLGDAQAAKAVADAKSYVAGVNAPYKATLQKQIEWLSNNTNDISQMELIGIDGFFAGAGAPASDKTYVTFLSASQHLLARGTVHVKSASAGDAPVIQPNYYNNKFDREVAVAGFKYLRKIAKTPQYSSYITQETVPGTSVSTDAQIENFVTTTGFVTEYHPLGTASMLPRNAGGVVDSKLKVYGTTNVRVIDASIIPVHISAHIMRTIYGVALKGADIVLAAA